MEADARSIYVGNVCIEEESGSGLGSFVVFFFFSFVFILGRVCYIAQTGHCFKVILQSQPTEYNSTLLFGVFFFFGGVGPYVSLADLALVL